MVRVHVAGDERRYADRLGEVAQDDVAAHVAALVRTLQLDEEAVATECLCEVRGGVRVANGEAVPCAAGEADEALVQLLEQRLVERRLRRGLGFFSGRPCVRVRGGEEAAEVRVALLRL